MFTTIYAHQSRQSNVLDAFFIYRLSQRSRTKDFICNINPPHLVFTESKNIQDEHFRKIKWRVKDKNVSNIPNVNEASWGERSWGGGLNTIVWSSMQSHATWSLADCSFLLKGLNRTVTTIFSSLTLDPPGVDTGVLSVFEAGVLGVRTVIFKSTFVLDKPIKKRSTK